VLQKFNHGAAGLKRGAAIDMCCSSRDSVDRVKDASQQEGCTVLSHARCGIAAWLLSSSCCAHVPA
jgi:hypothetical protein